MSKKILITEEEKLRIKKLYSLFEQQFNPLDIVLGAAMKRIEDVQSGKVDSEEDSDSTDETDTEETEYTKSGDISDFYEITKKVIENFEGGYWNPECAKFPGSKHPAKAGMYSRSGETMFGLDREAGNIENVSADGKKFFQVIDNEKKKAGSMENFCRKWVWNFRGGETKNQLMDLAVKTMKSLYDKNAKLYLSDKAKKVVESSRPLLLHFSYATWNGPGFFKDFAKSINKAVDEGKSGKELVRIAKSDRDRRFGSGSWAKANEKVKSLIDKESQNIS
jgi:uncharacterized protein YifE (UPF0438 family)